MKAPWYRDGFWWAVISAQIFGVIAIFMANNNSTNSAGPLIILFLCNLQIIGAITILKRRVSYLETILTDEGPLGRLKRRQVGLPEISHPFQPAPFCHDSPRDQ